MDNSNPSNVFICGWMTMMNEWGISCPSGPPKIEGGNEEDQRNIMEKVITKLCE